MGNDSGKFTRTCVKCSSKIEIDIDSETEIQASLLERIGEKQAKRRMAPSLFVLGGIIILYFQI